MVGAGLAWAASIVAWNLFRLAQAGWLLRMQPFGPWVVPVTVATAVFTGVGVLIRLGLDSSTARVQVVLGIAIPSLVYVGALLVLRVVKPTDLRVGGSVLRLVWPLGRSS
jgi:hypothetical protein